MSDARAIGVVTASLQSLLQQGLNAADLSGLLGAEVLVKNLPPDQMPIGGDEMPWLNVYFHQALMNQGWRNLDARMHDATGQRTANPPLALDLRYLITAYGRQAWHADVLLGHAMQILHETPAISPAVIRGLTQPKLAGSGLDEQVDRVRVAPEPLGGEEMSRLWSALQARSRPTAAYRASVVLIESKRSVRGALPVRERNIQVQTLRPAHIESVEPALVVSGGSLTVRGVNLSGPGVAVRFATNDVAVTPLDDGTIVVALPASLPAGVATVQIVRAVEFGTAADPHRGFDSNVAAFVVAPTITTVLSPVPSVARGSDLALDIAPAARAGQRVELILGDNVVPVKPFVVPSQSLVFPVPAQAVLGEQLVRVRIDGIASQLVTDSDPASATFGRFIGPRVKVTA